MGRSVRKNVRSSGEIVSPRRGILSVGSCPAGVFIELRNRTASLSISTPLWCTSSPMYQSVTGACGETAFTAGCPLKPPIRA